MPRRPSLGPLTTIALAIATFLSTGPAADAGGLIRAPAVGGIYVDAEGVVSAPPRDGAEQLQATWQAGLQEQPGELEPLVELRFVSLRKLDDAIAEARESGEPLPDAIRYLGGLLRVKHVLVYPPAEGEEQGDIVIAGPAEGWRVDELGNTVGITTGRPVLMLDDLIVALRSAEDVNGPGISCSIDPTPEGLAASRKVARRVSAGQGPLAVARLMEQALGQQQVSIAGVPDSSHFARTLVAADFRMKRLAMGFEASPVNGLPSYLDIVNPRKLNADLLPRWWLAADYEPLRTAADGLAWEIRGKGVKCQAEQDFLQADGTLDRGADRGVNDATRWAERMSDRFEELADADSAFGHVRNAFDLSVVGALLAMNELWDAAKLAAPQLMADFPVEEYDVPREVATEATFLKKGGSWIITASGGVQVFPWEIADRTEEDPTLAEVRDRVATADGDNWWWE